MSELQTLKSDLTKTRIVDGDNDRVLLDEGEIAVKIERFAFTVNNITYGVAGDTMGYWQFFPSSDDPTEEWGCIPMWGFAKISHSNNENLGNAKTSSDSQTKNNNVKSRRKHNRKPL